MYPCFFFFLQYIGRIAASCTFVEYSCHLLKQKCSCSKRASDSPVHHPSSIWRTGSTERGLTGSSGGLETRMLTEGTLPLQLNSIPHLLSCDGRELFTLTHQSRRGDRAVSFSNNMYSERPGKHSMTSCVLPQLHHPLAWCSTFSFSILSKPRGTSTCRQICYRRYFLGIVDNVVLCIYCSLGLHHSMVSLLFT